MKEVRERGTSGMVVRSETQVNCAFVLQIGTYRLKTRQVTYVRHNTVAPSPNHCCSENNNAFCVFSTFFLYWAHFSQNKTYLT